MGHDEVCAGGVRSDLCPARNQLFDHYQPDILEAVESCRRWVSSQLARRGAPDETDRALQLILTEMWQSLCNWDKAGRPPLGPWAGRIMKDTMHQWEHQERTKRALGRGETQARFIGADVAELELPDLPSPIVLVGPGADGEPTYQDHLKALLTLKAMILAMPDGARRWARVERNAQRNTVHASRLRIFLTTSTQDGATSPQAAQALLKDLEN